MQVSLNRIEGIITFPAAFFQKPVVGSFKEVEAYFVASAGADGYANSEELKLRDTFSKKPGALLTASYEEPHQEWSLYVWYMDKNRPLPPGNAFDPYREQDFERRKAEGFPRPLYSSAIPTPEATPEQQAERKRIGGW